MNGRSVVIATPAFARTRCLRCGHYVRPGQAVVSTVDGFRHLGCAMVTDDNIYCRYLNLFWGGTFLFCQFIFH